MPLSITPKFEYRIAVGWNVDLSADATYNVEVLDAGNTDWLLPSPFGDRYFLPRGIATFDELARPTLGNTTFISNGTIQTLFPIVNINAWAWFVDTYIKDSTNLGACSLRARLDTTTYENWNVSVGEYTRARQLESRYRAGQHYLLDASITWALDSVIT